MWGTNRMHRKLDLIRPIVVPNKNIATSPMSSFHVRRQAQLTLFMSLKTVTIQKRRYGLHLQFIKSPLVLHTVIPRWQQLRLRFHCQLISHQQWNMVVNKPLTPRFWTTCAVFEILLLYHAFELWTNGRQGKVSFIDHGYSQTTYFGC